MPARTAPCTRRPSQAEVDVIMGQAADSYRQFRDERARALVAEGRLARIAEIVAADRDPAVLADEIRAALTP